MFNKKLISLLVLMTLTACASSTPIAVRTPTYQVPAVAPAQRAEETATLQELIQASSAWSKWLSDSTPPTSPPKTPF